MFNDSSSTLAFRPARVVAQPMFLKDHTPSAAAWILSAFFTRWKEYPLDALPSGFFLENHRSRETLIAAATQLR
jgi:hypothetical protein